jgi:hypothetical protein
MRKLQFQNRGFAIGDIVPIGGGGVNLAKVQTLIGSALLDIPSDCPTSRFWFAGG